MLALPKDFSDIRGLILCASGLKFALVCGSQVRSHVISTISQVDPEVLVSKDGLIIAKDAGGKLRAEGGDISKPGP